MHIALAQMPLLSAHARVSTRGISFGLKLGLSVCFGDSAPMRMHTCFFVYSDADAKERLNETAPNQTFKTPIPLGGDSATIRNFGHKMTRIVTETARAQ